MAQLGSRLFFLVMDSGAEVTPQDLLESDDGPSYLERLTACKSAVHPFLTALFKADGGVRGVKWTTADDPKPVREWIARLATILAAMRSEPQREGDPDEGRTGLTPAKREQPRRAYAVLRNLARGRALTYGRRQLAEGDLPMVARVVVSSMPGEAARVFPALVQAGQEGLTVSQVRQALGVRHPETARGVMEDLGVKAQEIV
jgi:hypothetical protein